METDLVTCASDETLQDVAVSLIENGVGSAIVLQDGDPIGILTETDALRAGAATNRPFDEIPVADVYSHPLVTVTGDTSIRKAVARMRENDVKKLPVVEGMQLEGIVTQTDITVHYGDFIREAHELDQRRERWEAKKADPDEF